MTRFIAILIPLILAPTVGNAQERAYEPSHDNPTGEEIVLVFISSTWCAGSRAPGLHEAIEEAKVTLADRADADAVGFRAMAIGLDWATVEIAADRGPSPTFGERRILKRVAGAEQIVEWVRAGIDLQGS